MSIVRFIMVATLLAGLVAPRVAVAHPSALGPSGGLTIPNTKTLPPERTQVAVHAEMLREFSPQRLAVETVADLSPKVLVGVYEHLELGIEQTLRVNSGFKNESVTINGKYRFPFDTFDVAVGLLVPTSTADWTSAYVVMGFKVLWGGFGVNFGGRRFREITQDRFVNVGTAKLGGYNLRREVRNGTDVFTGEPDTFFGLVGLDYKVAEHFELLADYNGDRFSAGIRLPYHSWGFDAAYITQKANDSLFSRETQHVRVGFFGSW